MKIYLPNDSQQGLGGGWTFRRNLEKGLIQIGHEVTNNLSEASVALVASPTMVTKETIQQIKQSPAKLVVRLDNVPRNSRNRNTGTSRLKSFAQQADAVVWQSEWARGYLMDFIEREGTIIYNGVDTDIFNETGPRADFGPRENIYLYSRFNRDETKNWEKAWYRFQLISRENHDARLILVGNFSPEQIEYDFDFFRGEKYDYLGIIQSPDDMAKIMRGCGSFLATYFNDCYSNTYQEALACGMGLLEADMSGGTPELLKNGIISLKQMAQEYEKLFESLLV